MGPGRRYSRCDPNWQVGTKNDDPEEVEQIFRTMTKYGEINDNYSNRTSGTGSEI